MRNTIRRAAVVAASIIVLATSGLCAGAWVETSNRGAVIRQRAERLPARLRAGEPIRIIAFGDSLTAGWGTDGRHVYCRTVADALQYAFPDAPVELVTRGHPGESTVDALRRFDAEVRAGKPDLLLVQFGGNDMGGGRSVGEFRRDLARLLRRCATETDAVVVACLPPIVHPDAANEWSEGARAVAAEIGVPAADLDRAIREGDADSRGPFPYGSHPDSFTHVIMAREVLRALREACGVKPTFRCRLERGSAVSAEAAYVLRAVGRNEGEGAVDAWVQVEWQDGRMEQRVRVDADQEEGLEWKLPLPRFGGHSRSHPVRVLVRDGAIGDADVAWLTMAPAVRADGAWQDLSEGSLVVGRHRWLGPGDLGARFAVAALPESLIFTVEITDDDLTAGHPDDPSSGDSIELYLDLRSDAHQGKPVYGEGVIALQITPPAGGEAARWRTMEPLPEALKGMTVECARADMGYGAVVTLPLAAVTALRGGPWPGLGFDIGVNDADHGGIRKTQMMWTGYPDAYLYPGYLGGLYLDALPPNATRQTLR